MTSREQYINKTVDNDTVLAALLEVMVETSMMLLRWVLNKLKTLHNRLRFTKQLFMQGGQEPDIRGVRPVGAGAQGGRGAADEGGDRV